MLHKSYLLFFIAVFQVYSGRVANVYAQTVFKSSAENHVIEFITVPAYGSNENLKGRVHNVSPDSFDVAVYIFVEGSGWWTKPSFAQPLTPIQSDSTWTTDITTGGSDVFATRIHAFLIHKGINPPLLSGEACLPASLDTLSIANVSTMRNPRIISFSGREWWLKTSVGAVGPGPNFFSDSTDNVWVDEQGQLHLRITYRNGKWYCSEVVSRDFLGYGKYIFRIIGKIGSLNENVVLGLFTWDNDACEQFHREIDVEFSRWGLVTDPNAQYVVQPYTTPGNRYRWTIPSSIAFSTHIFEWNSENICFQGYKGSAVLPDSIMQSWNYTRPNIPVPGKENTRINLWLNNGDPPSDNSEVEVIVAAFQYDLINSVEEAEELQPHDFALSQNFPNPFNTSTRIDYAIPKLSHVTLTVYDLLGREVAVLANQEKPPGNHAVFWQANDLSSGIYLYRLTTDMFSEIKKMILVK